MKPTLDFDVAQVFLGNCLDVLPTLADNSVDSIVCDPPYELGFMGKSWDASGIAYDVNVWRECLRVLKPGGHLLAFGGSRTWHRLAVAIEDAGFELRDSIAWIYGSGFPKSHNISKAIDKMQGGQVKVGKAFKVAGEYGDRDLRDPEIQGASRDEMRHVADTDDAKKWDGWGTALKPAFEPVVVARKPLIGTVAENVLTWGTGGLNIDASRIGTETISVHNAPTGSFAGGEQDRGSDTESYREHIGRWPANVIFGHTEDCVEVGVITDIYSINKTEEWTGFGQKERPDYTGEEKKVSTPLYECVDGCPVKELDEQSGQVKSAGIYQRGDNYEIDTAMFPLNSAGNKTAMYNDKGGASRFFYVAKANKKDRNEGLDELPMISSGVGDSRPSGDFNQRLGTNDKPAQPRQNFHPTVKPTQLMRYLIKLVTPPNGIVLDPFAGSGSTGKAAILENYRFIGIEVTEEYLPIIEGRIRFAIDTKNQVDGDDLFANL